MQELIVRDGCGLRGLTALAPDFFSAYHAALAKHTGVFLAGNFFGHHEDQLEQGIRREDMLSVEKYARLADIFYDSREPGVGALGAITHRQIDLQPAGTGRPGWTLLRMSMAAASRTGFGHNFDALGAAHGFPVIAVLRSAHQADLVVVAILRPARP